MDECTSLFRGPPAGKQNDKYGISCPARPSYLSLAASYPKFSANPLFICLYCFLFSGLSLVYSLASADTATSTNVFKICFGYLHLEVFLGVETFPDKEGVKEYKKFEN